MFHEQAVAKKTVLEWVLDDSSLSCIVYRRHAEIQKKQIERAAALKEGVFGGLLKGMGALILTIAGALGAEKFSQLDSPKAERILAFLNGALVWFWDSGVWYIATLSMLGFVFVWGMTRYHLFRSTRDIPLGQMSFIDGSPRRITDEQASIDLSKLLLEMENDAGNSMLFRYELPRMIVFFLFGVVLSAILLGAVLKMLVG